MVRLRRSLFIFTLFLVLIFSLILQLTFSSFSLFPVGRGQKEDPAVNAVVCHSPLSNLGYCRKGSTLSVSVAFQILRAGLFEVMGVLVKKNGCKNGLLSVK